MVKSKRAMVKPLSLKPVKRGNIYCSPGCGHGCTVAQHKAAMEAGSGLAKRLGRGWKFQVWENLGWHYCAVSSCGKIKVHGSRYFVNALNIDYIYKGKASYTAFLNGGQFRASDKNPRTAVRDVVAQGFLALNQSLRLMRGLAQYLPLHVSLRSQLLLSTSASSEHNKLRARYTRGTK